MIPKIFVISLRRFLRFYSEDFCDFTPIVSILRVHRYTKFAMYARKKGIKTEKVYQNLHICKKSSNFAAQNMGL